MNQAAANDAGFRDGSNLLFNNNQEVQAKNSGGTTKKLLRLDNDNYMRVSQLPFKTITANSIVEDVLIQSGWDYVVGDGAATELSKGITLPVTYDTILWVGINKLGNRAIAPVTIMDFDLEGQDGSVSITASAHNIVTFGFTAQVVKSTGAFANNVSYGFSWIALGIKS